MAINPLDSIWRVAKVPSAAADLTGVVRHYHASNGPKALRNTERKVAAPRQEPGTDFVDALAHGISVLECWRGTDVWLSNSELAERSGLTRPTVSRLASVLENLGYLARENKRGRLRLTSATLGLGFGSALSTCASFPPRVKLEDLANELDVYAALSIRRIDKVQIVENVASPRHPDAVLNDVGALLPICRSASGLAAMSALPEQDISPMIPRLMAHYGNRWANLERQLTIKRKEYTSKGYCTSVSILSQDVGAVAIPILPAGSNDIYILACGMPALDFYAERIERSIAPKMLSAARALKDAFSR